MSDLPSRIKSRRLDMGLSQSKLAKLCNVSQPTITNWENGDQFPRQAALKNLSSALNVEESWLLSGHSSRGTDPLTAHISKPIRNVPVYALPTDPSALQDRSPIDFITLSTDIQDPIAFLFPETDLLKGRIIRVFSKTPKLGPTEMGLFWTPSGLIFGHPPGPSVSAIGRLVMTLINH